MEKAAFLQRIKQDLPELQWKNYGHITEGVYFITGFFIDQWQAWLPLFYICSPKLLWETILEEMKNRPDLFPTESDRDAFEYKIIDKDCGDKFTYSEDIRIEIPSLSEKEFEFLVSVIKKWETKCDTLRRSYKDEDQIVIIHPDLTEDRIPLVLKDFKCIVSGTENEDWRAGIISTKDWDFGNEKLRMALYENSGDCFDIEEADEEYSLSWRFSDAGCDLIRELEKVYPGASEITKIYTTDWD